METADKQCDTLLPKSLPLYSSNNNGTVLNELIPSIDRSNYSQFQMANSATSSSGSTIADFIQIPVFALIIIFASIYIGLVLSRRTLRSAKFTWLTVNVCFTNIFFAIIQLFSIGIRLNNISETSISCRSKGFIINMSTCNILYSHCTASFCRLLSIRYPHKLLFKATHWLLSNIGVSWIIGVLVALPYLFLDSFTCTGSDGKRFLQIYTSLSTILLPVIIVALCNIVIFRYVRRSTKRVQNFSENNPNNTHLFSKRDMSLCKIMLLTFCVFVMGWMPLFVEQVFFNEDKTRLASGVSIFFQILSSTSLLIDVIVLIYSDQPVRIALLNVLKCNEPISH